MADIRYLRREDEAVEKNKAAALAVLEAVAQSIRENKCNGMILVAFERDMSGGPDVEMTVQRYYLSGGVGDMLTLMGLNRCVMDEMSEGSRVAMDME